MRIEGCESKNHEECSGELRECPVCQRDICYEDGGDDDDLCDDCHQNTVVIHVKGGLVYDVTNLPDDWHYYVDDRD